MIKNMKKIKFAVIAMAFCMKLSAQADLGINSLMTPALVANGASGLLTSDVSNAGFTDITAGCATVTISVPSGISQITGVNPGTNAVWQATNSPLTFPRTSITFRNLNGVIPADLTNYSIVLDVQGIALGGPSTITTAVALTGAFTQPGCTALGNLNTGNDNSTTSITVAVVTPVKLSAFTVASSDCKAILKWTSETEENSRQYEVERSFDGRVFTSISTMPAAGNSSVQRFYSFTDDAPASGYSYYRLKVTSLNGEVTYSSVLTLHSKCKGTTVRLHPNPVSENNNLTIVTAGYTGGIRGELLTLSGTVLRGFKLVNGTNTLRIEGIAQGTYTLRVTDVSSGDAQSFKVIVIKR